ncbi:MAG: hypothetical protein H9Q65_00735 [Spiroplasma ixodetis]|nr:hypothetical protein [Spiroplasma ixodetis]MBP1526494.1 hypothetical protein [Spiroplasma ixodetis]MBP1527769.1 hypothetical protein [Spiroplasma ixodetis]
MKSKSRTGNWQSGTRREIFKYYIPQTEVEIVKDKINLLDSSSIVTKTTIKRDYGLNM